MILITGPMFSGKKEYACRMLGCSAEELGRYAVWDVQELAAACEDPEALAEKLAEHPVVITTEVGCGVVPVDAAQRRYREAAGRLACLLSKRADRVIRICCGLPQVLKES